MRRALFAGSFDPMTMGHLSIIERASSIFDELYVVVAYNIEKKYILTPEERVELISETLTSYSNVKVVMYSGLIAQFAKENGIKYLVRGIRNSQDAQYEIELAMNNKYINNELETVLLPSEKEHMITSSSQVKQFASFGVDISPFVPQKIRIRFLERIKDN